MTADWIPATHPQTSRSELLSDPARIEGIRVGKEVYSWVLGTQEFGFAQKVADWFFEPAKQAYA